MKNLFIALLGVLLVSLLTINSVSTAGIPISCGGSSYDAQLFQATMFAYNLLHPETSFSYAATGSGAGRRGTAGTQTPFYAFGASDSPLTASEFGSLGSDMFVLPALAAAIVPIYNIPGANLLSSDYSLRLQTNVLAKIFMANITYWDDPLILADNPKLNSTGLLTHERIRIVVRLDSSGTSRMFTQALYSFYPEFRNSGILTSGGSFSAIGLEAPVWQNVWNAGNGNLPYILRGNLNSGVADYVLSTPFSIGYSVLAQALERQILYSQLQNSQGQWITASVDSVTYAMYELAVLQGANAQFLPSATNLLPINIANPSSKPAWPLAGMSYTVLKGNSTFFPCSQRAAVVEYLLWFYTSSTAAEIAKLTGYNQLPLLLYQALDMENIIKSKVLCNYGRVTAYGTIAGSTNTNTGGTAGASIVNPYFSLSAASYPTKDLTTNLNFASTSSQAALLDITSPTRKTDFGVVIQSVLDPAALPAANQLKGYTLLPYMIAPLLPVYTYKFNTSAIKFNFDVLGKVFTGEINVWNDTAIIALNPTVSLNGQKITVVIPQQNTVLLEATPVFVNALFTHSAAFRACYTSTGNNANFNFFTAAKPGCGPNNPNFGYQSVLYENYIQSTVADIDGSIGVTYTPYGIEASILNLVSPHDSTTVNTFYNPLDVASGVTDPRGTRSLGNCLSDTVAVTGDLKSYTFEAAQSNNPLCWPLVATISILLPGKITEIDTNTKQSILQYINYLFNEPAGVYYSRGLDLGFYILSSSAELINPGVSQVGKVQSSAQRILTILTGQPTLFIGDDISQTNSGQFAVLSFVFATVGAWTTLILVEQVVYDTKLRRDSFAYYGSIAAASATFSIVAQFASLWVSMAEISLSAPVPSNLDLSYNPAMMILSFIPGFALTFIAFFIMTKAIQSARKTASASTNNQSGATGTGTGTNNTNSKNSEGSSTDKSGVANSEGVNKPGGAPAANAPRPAALDLDSLVSVFGNLITKYTYHSFVCTVLLLCGEVILIVMSRGAISSNLSIKYDSGLIAAAVIVFFVICSIGVQCLFWLVRFRFIGAFVLGSACFAADQLILDAQTNTWKGDSNSTPSDYWSTTTVTLIASIVAAGACFLLLGLQFSRMKLSRNELDLIVAKLGKNLKKAEKDILLGKAKLVKQKGLTNYLQGITHLISYIRPNALNSITAGMLVSNPAFEPQVLTAVNNQSTIKFDTTKNNTTTNQIEHKVDEDGNELSDVAGAGGDDDNDPIAQFEQSEMSANARLKYFQQVFTALTQDLSTSNEGLNDMIKSITLLDILNNPMCLELFKDAVGKELSTEHISFYLACKQFSSKQFTPENNLRKLLGSEIMKCFIEPKAKYTINISSRTRQALISSYKTSGATVFNSTFFAPAQKEVYNLLAQDSFERFVKTPQFVVAGMIINSAKIKGFNNVFTEGYKPDNSTFDTASVDGGSQREASRTKGSKIGKSILSKLPTRVIKTQIEEDSVAETEQVKVELQSIENNNNTNNTATTTSGSTDPATTESKQE